MHSYHLLQGLLLVHTVFSIPVAQLSAGLQTIRTLQDTWYDPQTGLWEDLWWNSANCLTAIGNFQLTDPSNSAFNEEAGRIYETTFQGGLAIEQFGLGKQSNSWMNEYYDDEGWWALAWIKIYDITNNQTYLNAAQDIYRDMKAGFNTTTCGGLVWKRTANLLSSIENSLFLDIAAQLAVRVGISSTTTTDNEGEATTEETDYLADALAQYFWLTEQTSLYVPDQLIPDGLDPSTCLTIGTEYTYNQGALMSALVSLHLATAKSTNNSPVYLDAATSLALISMDRYASPYAGILTESCDPTCEATAAQFKGVLVRALAALQAIRPRDDVRDSILTNAHSIWSNGRGEDGKIGSGWAGPYMPGPVSATCAGLDGLTAAAGVGKEGGSIS